MVCCVVVTRCWARASRTVGGTDCVSARSMSSRSGAVYWSPVSPVWVLTVSAAVRPQIRSMVVEIWLVTPSP